MTSKDSIYLTPLFFPPPSLLADLGMSDMKETMPEKQARQEDALEKSKFLKDLVEKVFGLGHFHEGEFKVSHW